MHAETFVYTVGKGNQEVRAPSGELSDDELVVLTLALSARGFPSRVADVLAASERHGVRDATAVLAKLAARQYIREA